MSEHPLGAEQHRRVVQGPHITPTRSTGNSVCDCTRATRFILSQSLQSHGAEGAAALSVGPTQPRAALRAVLALQALSEEIKHMHGLRIFTSAPKP